MTSKRRLLICLVLFLIYEIVVCLAAFAWSTGPTFWLFVFVLTALGLTALIVYLSIARLLARSTPAPAPVDQAQPATPAATSPEPAADAGQIEEIIREADRRLAKSLTTDHRPLTTASLPLYILAGPAGVGKTSTFLGAGLSPELLAGQVYRDSTVLPTSLCNFWYAADAIFAEAGGRFFSDTPAQWRALAQQLCEPGGNRLLRKLRTGGVPQANLRGLIWFCDITPFLGMPDTPRVEALARKVQERMLVLGEVLGSNFPVYVVFTKADQLPHFDDFARRLSDQEDRDVLGCTLPVANAPSAGEVYADAQTRRLLEPFNQLYAALAGKRTTLLAREPESAHKPGIYEFPRELKRVRDSLIHFLTEAFRPNPLQPGPLLRGFYFTGVRQVSAAAASPGAIESRPGRRPASGDATVLFHSNSQPQTPAASAAQNGAQAPEETVSRWVFARQLFHSVVLADPLSRALGVKNVRREMRHRILLWAATAVCAILTLCLVRSWWGNWTLLAAVKQSARVDLSRAAAGGIPALSDLRAMDELRQALAPLASYNRDGAPWRLRWGLYSGERVYRRAYDAYFELFHQYFFTDAQSAMTGRLARLEPQTGSVSYNSAYDTLKAYRMTTSRQCPADTAFLVPVFTQAWQGGRTVDAERAQLVEQQVRFYAGELGHTNPYSTAENAELVERGRSFLSAFGGMDRLLRGILEDANKQPRQPSRIADIAPNFRQVLTGPGEVKAAFTRDGWTYVEQAIREPGRQSVGEPCVVGTDAAAQVAGAAEAPQIAAQLNALYTRAYIQAWKNFAGATGVQPFRSAADAARSLDILSDNRSPLLAALFLVADNTNLPKAPAATESAASSRSAGLLRHLLPVTAKKTSAAGGANAIPVSTADIDRVFQPVREVVRPGNRDRLIDDPNRTYIDALGEMQRAMARLQNDPVSNPDLALHQQAQHAAESGLDAVRQIAQRFNINGSEGVDLEVKRLLESPFRYSLRFIITDPAKAGKDKAAGAAKAFCARFAPLSQKFPFNPLSDTDAGADEVAAIFAPQSSALAALEQQLAKLVVRQGRQWVQNPETPSPQVAPEFLQFLNRASALSDALFANASPQMKMRYALRPLPAPGIESISLDIDGDHVIASGQTPPKPFNWPGAAGAQQVLIRVKAGANIPFASYEGLWGIFRMLLDADPRAPGSRVIELSKVRRGHGRAESVLDQNDKPIQVRLEVTELPSGIDVFDRNFFQIRCPSKAVE